MPGAQVSLLDFFWRRSYSAVEASERCRLARALLLALGVAYYLGLKLSSKSRSCGTCRSPILVWLKQGREVG